MRDCENCKNHTDKGCTKWECEFEPTTKSNLGVDCISRDDVREVMQELWGTSGELLDRLMALPSVTPQEPQSFKWCTDCKEYDQEKHCCHRWSKVIRDTVEEMKQEPIKPMVEIDLYSVIKQKYIEREVLDEMRVEIEMEKLEDSPNICIKAHNLAVDRVLGIIDKYKAETEAEDGNVD